jgi:hypothetical protein
MVVEQRCVALTDVTRMSKVPSEHRAKQATCELRGRPSGHGSSSVRDAADPLL